MILGRSGGGRAGPPAKVWGRARPAHPGGRNQTGPLLSLVVGEGALPMGRTVRRSVHAGCPPSPLITTEAARTGPHN